MKKAIYLLAIPVVMVSYMAFARVITTNVRARYSVIEGVQKLGKNPFVTIDGKEYKPGILYNISYSCIQAVSVIYPDGTPSNSITKDGYVKIKTKTGNINYLTNIEKDNLVKIRSVPDSQFYNRIHLKQEDGKLYDMILMQTPSGYKVSAQLTPSGKAAFIINKKIYNEDAIKSLSPELIASLSPYTSEGPISKAYPGIDLKGYEIFFSFKTDKH